jgi:Protein of unknown function (DUF2510)/Thioredoxin 2, N-terminal
MTFITSEFGRSVGAPTGDVNRVVQDALRGAGLEITSQSLTLIEASRGSKLAMAMLGGFALKKIPFAASARLEPYGQGCYLAVRLVDDWSVAYGPASAVANRYGQVFADVRQAIDAALLRLTPAVREDWTQVTSTKQASDVMAKVAQGMENSGAHAARTVQGVLTRERAKAERPWDAVEQVRFEADAGAALLTMLDVQAMLDTGTLIATRADSLPPDLLDELQHLQARVEQALSGRRGAAAVPLRDAEMPAFEFLRQQASLRNHLPLRTLQECADCHTRRLLNLDYQKILARNKALRNIGGGLGAAIAGGRIHPFVVFGRVMNFAKLDPDFACAKCQGMSATELIVALCSNCGEVQQQAVLTTCLKCHYDLRTSLPPERLWSDREDEVTRPPLGTAARWLADPAGRHELRYWNGHDWTVHVADDGQATTDALKDLLAAENVPDGAEGMTSLAAGSSPSATRTKRQGDNEAMAGGLIRCEHCGQANRVPAAAAGTPHCGKCHQPLPAISPTPQPPQPSPAPPAATWASSSARSLRFSAS